MPQEGLGITMESGPEGSAIPARIDAKHPKVLVWAEATAELVGRADKVVVRSQQDFDAAGEVAVLLKRALSDVESDRKRIKQPYEVAGKSVDGAFRPMADRLKAAREIVDERMTRWFDAEEAKRRTAERQTQLRMQQEREKAILKAFKDGKDEEAGRLAGEQAAARVEARAPIQAEPAKTTHLASGGSVTVTRRWTFRIEDPTAIPRQFLTPDEKAIGRAVNEGARNPSIPGVNIYEESGVSTR